MGIAIELSDQQAQGLSETARRLHVSEADLASAAVRDLVPRQSVDFKTAANRVLGFSLIQNHPFMDGNKRFGHAVMETTLMLNGVESTACMPWAWQSAPGASSSCGTARSAAGYPRPKAPMAIALLSTLWWSHA